MGEEAVGDKESKAGRRAPALGPERFIARELSQLGSDDSLNQGNVSLLQRVDRLDNILSVMEDKAPTEPSGNSFRSQARRCISSTPSSLEKRCKSTESVLEEVEEKGTLVERVSELENRLMKLQRMITTKSSDNVAYPGFVEFTTSAHSIPPCDEATSHHHDHEQSLQDLIDVEKHEVTTVSSAPLEYDQHHEPFIYSENIDISPPRDEATSHHHDHDHEQSLQDLIDVEKHEVTTVSSAPLEYDQHHESFIYSEKIDISPRKEESLLHMEGYSEKIDISPRKKECPLHMEGQQGMVSSEGASVEEEDPGAHRQQSKKKSQKIKRWLSKRLHIGSSTGQGKHTCSTGHCWSSHTNPKSCWNLKRGELHASSTYTHHVSNSIDEDSP